MFVNIKKCRNVVLDRLFCICYNNQAENNEIYAGVAELADAPDLGSGVYDVGVRGLSPAPAGKPRSKLGTIFWS